MRSGPGQGGWGHGEWDVLTSDLQAGLALPSAVLIHCFASVEASVAPLGGQDPQPAQPPLRLLGEAPLVWAHGLAVPQPVRGARTQTQGPGPSPAHEDVGAQSRAGLSSLFVICPLPRSVPLTMGPPGSQTGFHPDSTSRLPQDLPGHVCPPGPRLSRNLTALRVAPCSSALNNFLMSYFLLLYNEHVAFPLPQRDMK